jgi:hypothetical protein
MNDEAGKNHVTGGVITGNNEDVSSNKKPSNFPTINFLKGTPNV